MNGLFKYIPPFAPDQSGATAVLFSLGGIIVICDAGGCAGNICGFDEPRWFTEKSAIFSAGLRDMDAILGRDERLMQKLKEAKQFINAKFVAIIGTPVPAVIGTDFRALRRMAEKCLNTTVLALDTTGIGHYDEGEEKAYLALLATFAQEKKYSHRYDVGVFGATPLNLPYKGGEKEIKTLLEKKYGTITLFTGEKGINDIKNAGGAKLNIAISASGIKPCEYLKQRFGTEYRIEFPLQTQHPITKNQQIKTNDGQQLTKGKQSPPIENLKKNGNSSIEATKQPYAPATQGFSGEAPTVKSKNSTLIIHQQILANSIREMLEKNGETADVASWFKLHKNYARERDIRLAEEDAFFALLKERKYKRIIADPIFKRCLTNIDSEFIPICHYASSGELFAAEAKRDWQQILNLLKRQKK